MENIQLQIYEVERVVFEIKKEWVRDGPEKNI